MEENLIESGCNIGSDYAKRARPQNVFIFHDVDLLSGAK